ncbi:MAG TPA: hypothetical protein VK469_10110 [Candidatus Kapabacteria bacterium]|nr:hypothetical protein [Candidatus Kapabacteria bacterium]
MNKKIILIGQQELKNASTFGIIVNSGAYIRYQSIEDFDIQNRKTFINAFKYPIKNSTEMPGMPDSTILNIINENATIKGLHQKAIKNSLKSLERHWDVISQSISNNSTIEDIIESLKNCKICAIDTSVYGKGESDINPYVFFCLGLGHGFQKEVVPLTYKSHDNHLLPFDIRGLWHIFYKDSEELTKQFTNIMPQIDKNWTIEQEGYLHKKTWTPFLSAGELDIMTYGRSEPGPRGIRTNIDKWDYTTVSELARFFALKFPKTQVNIAHPMSKLNENEINEKKKNVIHDILKDKDCIIIGSSNVSDLTEIILSKLHGIHPYENDLQDFTGYVIKKKLEIEKTHADKATVFKSSVYWQISKNENESEGICRYDKKRGEPKHFNNKYDKDEGEEIYGILTIANNPFVTNGPRRKIMILSGFSGIATYGIAKLLTHEDYWNELSELDTQYDKQNITRDQNVQILIRTTFSRGPKGIDDNRKFKSASFVEMMPI